MKGDTVEVLVRIPKKDFEELQSNYVWWGKHGEYIKKGTVLPKGHDDLIEREQVTNYDNLSDVPSVIKADKEVENEC